MSGDVPKQVGNDHPTAVPTSAYTTSDGHIIISGMPNRWPQLCDALGDPEMATRDGFATIQDRRKNRDAVNAAIDALTCKRTMAEWIEELNAIGIPCGPIYTLDQTFADPQVKHTGIAQSVHSEKLGDITLIGQPVHMSRSTTKLTVAPPEAGEHNDEILADLGYTPEQIADLRERAVL
jgi:formyl-CoA transferase